MAIVVHNIMKFSEPSNRCSNSLIIHHYFFFGGGLLHGSCLVCDIAHAIANGDSPAVQRPDQSLQCYLIPRAVSTSFLRFVLEDRTRIESQRGRWPYSSGEGKFWPSPCKNRRRLDDRTTVGDLPGGCSGPCVLWLRRSVRRSVAEAIKAS